MKFVEGMAIADNAMQHVPCNPLAGQDRLN
jgi:hypothetical protein